MRLRLALLACIAAGPALAQSAPPTRPPDQVRLRDGGTVFVWRDADRMSEAGRLIEAGVNRTQPQLLLVLVSCFVPSGTPVVVTASNMSSRTILVVDGPHVGCRGVVPPNIVVRAP